MAFSRFFYSHPRQFAAFLAVVLAFFGNTGGIPKIPSTWLIASASATQSTTFTLTGPELDRAVGERLQRVDELQFLSNWGQQHHCRVFGAGGTAAALAHYVRMDLEREWLKQHGLPQKYFEGRFDYNYFEIYRSTQDADIVLDCDGDEGIHEQMARKLETEIQQKFDYLQGSKSVWEVRFLRHTRFSGQGAGQKDSLFSPDFQNQHTDSHSTGLVEFTTPKAGERRIRDVKDWENHFQSPFLRDVLEEELHYYFSPNHATTKRFKEGHNPPILSVIRYFTKAFQYGLEIREEDKAHLVGTIEDFKQVDPKSLDSYVQKQINSNALKLFWHAQDVEFAANTLDTFGLRKFLIRIGGGSSGEMGIWLNREPLRTKPIGTGTGKTARELGITEVAHETNQYLAYENITRSRRGFPNVFISRMGFPGEAAVYGDGFYTQIGHYGARGTGLTIRFRLHPDARESLDGGKTGDFIRSGNYIVVLNKSALVVIDESIEISLVDYFKLLIQQEVDASDKGFWEKIERKVKTKLSQVDAVTIQSIDEIVFKAAGEKKLNKKIISAWLQMSTFKYENLLKIDEKFIEEFVIKDGREYFLKSGNVALAAIDYIRSEPQWAKAPVWIDKLIDLQYGNSVAHSILSQERWMSHSQTIGWIDRLVVDTSSVYAVFRCILSQSHWASHPKASVWIGKIIQKIIKEWNSVESGSSLRDVAEAILLHPDWAKHPRASELIENWFGDRDQLGDLMAILSHPNWANHPKNFEWKGKYIEKLMINLKKNDSLQRGSAFSYAKKILSQPDWAMHPKAIALIEQESKRWNYRRELISILSLPHWVDHPKILMLIAKIIENGDGEEVARCILSQPVWAERPEGLVLVQKIFERSSVDERYAKTLILHEPHWANHPRLLEMCDGKPLTVKNLEEAFRRKSEADTCSKYFKAGIKAVRSIFR